MTKTLFIRLLQHEDKGAALAERISALREGRADADVYAVAPESFRQVPNTPFCYWVSERIRRLFTELPPFESEGRTVKQGLATADDFRFVRAWWEVPAGKILDSWQYAVGSRQKAEEKWTEERIREFQAWCRKRTYEGKRWVPFAKGGEYSPYYADIHLVVNWENEGAEIKNNLNEKGGVRSNVWMLRDTAANYFFRPGLTWPRSTVKGLNVRILPGACVFADKGPAGFVGKPSQLPRVVGLFNSECYQLLLGLQQGSRAWEVGTVQKTAIPNFVHQEESSLQKPTLSTWFLKRSLNVIDDTSHAFTLPALLMTPGAGLVERADTYAKQTAEAEAELRRIQAEVDKIAFELYGFTDEERNAVGSGQLTVDSNEVSGGESPDTDDAEEMDSAKDGESFLTTDHRPLVTDLLSWCVGVAFGRFDIRLALDSSLIPGTPDPFDPLPVCPPGMLQGSDGLPAKPEDVLRHYPIRIDWDGILVDDTGHEDDIVRRVREVLEVIWKDRAEAIEKEACEILGVRELRDYFRKPAAGGFWMDHVRRYSKSRRKAPIYWYLRSAKGNYGLWLYHHRLDKDVLFKALLNYVEPKIRLEEDRLKSLRVRKEAVGSSGREAKQLEKDMDRQDQFVSELKNFEERLRRVANLHLDFDLNDGVILNIAPLWELVPWNEPKKYWQELQEGKYDWSHIAYQLWPERVQEACKKDRSIAIAHGQEDLCEAENPASKKESGRGRRKKKGAS
ncbi:MAG TPA: hypothetical protein DDZ40_08910 [Deltaproteobacteria bacterium]|nr:hypothetical protein [Deltaproteobacteria bacterium]